MRWIHILTACSLLAELVPRVDATFDTRPTLVACSAESGAWQTAGASDAVILIRTPFGALTVCLDHDLAPTAVHNLLDAARRRVQGWFERAEARPEIPDAPEGPYALLQGTFDDTLMSMPQEGTSTTIRAGDLVLIPHTWSFYIALENHDTWATAHSVIGSVTHLTVVDAIVIQSTHEFVHPEYRTTMRMLDDPVHFELTTDLTDIAMIPISHHVTTV